MFISNDGLKEIKGFPCLERQLIIWAIELKTNADVLFSLKGSQAAKQVTSDLGDFYYALVDRYGRKADSGVWARYTCFDDMKGHALCSLCQATFHFNPTKSNNPIAYFIQVIHNAFMQFINMQRKQHDIKKSLNYFYREDNKKDIYESPF